MHIPFKDKSLRLISKQVVIACVRSASAERDEWTRAQLGLLARRGATRPPARFTTLVHSSIFALIYMSFASKFKGVSYFERDSEIIPRRGIKIEWCRCRYRCKCEATQRPGAAAGTPTRAPE